MKTSLLDRIDDALITDRVAHLVERSREPEVNLDELIPPGLRRGGRFGFVQSCAPRLTDDGRMITAGILPSLDTPPVTPRRKKMVNHIGDLCVCQHSRHRHSSVLGGDTEGSADAAVTWLDGRPQTGRGAITDQCSGEREGQPCGCQQFQPVSPKVSKHAYVKGGRQRTMKRLLHQIRTGDRVLAYWASSGLRLRLTDAKDGGPMVVTVTGVRKYLPDAEASDQSPRDRALVFTTDLGESLPQLGGTPVTILL